MNSEQCKSNEETHDDVSREIDFKEVFPLEIGI